MKKIFVFIIILFFFQKAFANHISGGELFYKYIGPGAGANSSIYKVTMRLFRDCNSTGETLQGDIVVIGIYNNNSDLSLFTHVKLSLDLPLNVIQFDPNSIPCLSDPPSVCFQVGLFTGVVELPASPDGYVLSWIRCCRADGISNSASPNNLGATFVTGIPGTAKLPSGQNSSPQFSVKDAALVCQNKSFTLDFGATDDDGDILTYSFCDAYLGGSPGRADPGASTAGVPVNLPLPTFPYKAPFSGTSPLGPGVTIDPKSGQITGVAPSTGRYVINVCVTETRNGTIINTHRKDFILQIANCNLASADPLPVSGAWCKDFSVDFSNNNPSSTIQSYQWDFGDPSTTNDVSTEAAPVYTYTNAGVYTVKLSVKGINGCSDEKTTTIGVYPGIKANFSFAGNCLNAPFVFKDSSSAAYGVIDSWKWNFGDSSSAANTAITQNPSYQYASEGTKNAVLIITSSKGCTDTVSKPVVVNDPVALRLPFNDTLICATDTLPIPVTANGTFTWSPGYNIIQPNSADPLVFPKLSTTYIVSVTNQNGCSDQDSVRVNVVQSVSVFAGADTSICRSDAFTLQPVSNALHYHWTPSDNLSNPESKTPVARPDATTTYSVTASIGNCIASDQINIKVAPLPEANAGADVAICYNETTQLNGTVSGSFFTWVPGGTLLNSTTLTPVARPTSTTVYVLSASDTLGCPKIVSDSVVVKVIPQIHAFAGNDTTIVINQPLQLNATGGSVYMWSPATGMNNPFIANPVVILNATYNLVTYVVKVGVPEGCFVSDTLNVKVFKTPPDIFIPTAFTPNADGKNDILKPLPVGLSKFNYFKIFNRWGQLVYSTSSLGSGWDGTLNGIEEPAGTYVFVAQGTTYLGSPILKKGTVVLIR